MNDEDDSEFAGLMPGVKRMRSDRINVYAHRGRRKFTPRSHHDEIPAVETYAFEAAPGRDTFFTPGLQKKLQRKIRQGQIRPQASLDLHGYRQYEALSALDAFLEDVTRLGMHMVIVVHGQGYRSQGDAVLKPLVQRWLASQPPVLAWCPAQPRDGASGASYVYLRS